ncbi:hypothetical protein FS837_001924 [Tulasnella sp. UAMH 9824]|nr:hypothetical protein FS837_001924 [Tulasnella sp. UAMH 9824]
MVSFYSLLLLCAASAAVWAAPSKPEDKHELVSRQSTPTDQTGTSNGYYYRISAEVTCILGPGKFTVTAGLSSGSWICGLGWNPGSANRVITFSTTFNPSGNTDLLVYGWTTNPLVEYHIVDAFGSYNPASAAKMKGTVVTDGATYNIYQSTQVNAPSIQGTATFQQYWSIRQNKRTSGTVTTANHFNAWAALGMQLGTFRDQIFAVEGYQSSASASVTVGEGTPTPTTTRSTTNSSGSQTTTSSDPGGENCSPKYVQCGGQGWTGATCCQSGSTCKINNVWYSQCL